jgi:hypothetical protein
VKELWRSSSYMSTLKRCSHGPVKTYDYRILTAPPDFRKNVISFTITRQPG